MGPCPCVLRIVQLVTSFIPILTTCDQGQIAVLVGWFLIPSQPCFCQIAVHLYTSSVCQLLESSHNHGKPWALVFGTGGCRAPVGARIAYRSLVAGSHVCSPHIVSACHSHIHTYSVCVSRFERSHSHGRPWALCSVCVCAPPGDVTNLHGRSELILMQSLMLRSCVHSV